MVWLGLVACGSPSTKTPLPAPDPAPIELGTPGPTTPPAPTDSAPTGATGTPITDQEPPCDLAEVQRDPGPGWADSYAVDGRCYCDTTFDHAIGDVIVETPRGPRTVRAICDAIGAGPGADGHPAYNDVQCGNGPPNNAGDEDWCPGRVDQGRDGCCTIGPRWDLSVVP
ncbi:MAG: hypothetical protein AAF602_16710 [Myxococcota bacterium]